MRHAVIENGIAINIVDADLEFGQQQGWIPSEVAKIGDLWDGENFTTPPPVAMPTDYAALNRNSYKARLQGRADTLSKKGLHAEAMKLLLKANEV